MSSAVKLKLNVMPLVKAGVFIISLLKCYSGTAATYDVGLKRTGGFTVKNLRINEGDTVNFHGFKLRNGYFLPLEKTDAIVQIASPRVATGDVCGRLDNGFDHIFDPNDPNEFTGPLRKGVSGIFALGPDSPFTGFEEPAPGADCSTIPFNAAANEIMTEVSSVTDASGTVYKLCKKMIDTNGSYAASGLLDGDETNAGTNTTLLSTWDNPDITGVTVRLDWKDLQIVVNNEVVYDWSKLETELNRAAERGKTVFLHVAAGAGTPDWIFSDYTTPLINSPVGATQVTPVTLKDFGSGNVAPQGCGFNSKVGSPNDVHYQSLYLKLIEDVANFIKSDSRWFQSLGGFKISGLNLLTGEMRLPQRCLDPNIPGQEKCVCNTEIWAAPLGAPVVLTVNGRQENYTGGGYTQQGLYDFVTLVENKIHESFGKKKSMIYMMIQDGFPRVLDQNNFYKQAGSVGMGFPGSHIQTLDLMNFGQNGNFITPDGLTSDLSAGKLFIAQHSGLEILPEDQSLTPCLQQQIPTLNASGKYEAPIVHLGDPEPPQSEIISGCPNRYVVKEGYEGQVIGFQTANTSSITNADDVDSTLWNGTVNSNMTYWEGYEIRLWEILRAKGSGVLALPVSTNGTYASQGSQYQKNLAQWTDELHRRREQIALDNPSEPNMYSPFPEVHSHTFNKELYPNQAIEYFYINPSRCTGWQDIARIEVIGI